MTDLIMTKDQQLGVWDFSVKLAKSKIVPVLFQNKPEDVFAAVILGSELGLSPLMALGAIVIIQGQTTLKVQTMNAVVRAKCKDAIIEFNLDHDKQVARVKARRHKDDAGYESHWDMDMAARMGLASKDNWVKQPMNMLKARALSDALRAVFPDILLGIYSSEEIEDLPPMRNESKETMSQTLRREVEEDFPTPPEEKIVGPLYRITRGTYIGKQLKDIDVEDLEAYLENTLKKKKNPLPWHPELAHVIEQYVTNYQIYREDPAIEAELVEA